jgi:hypothetical protein
MDLRAGPLLGSKLLWAVAYQIQQLNLWTTYRDCNHQAALRLYLLNEFLVSPFTATGQGSRINSLLPPIPVLR